MRRALSLFAAVCLSVGAQAADTPVSSEPAAAATPAHVPFLWQWQHQGKQHCLIGSVHALPINRPRLPAALQACVDTAQAVAFEALGQVRLTEADYVRRLGAIAESQQGGLLSRLDDATTERLRGAVDALGLSLDSFRHFKPWFAAQTLAGFMSVESQLSAALGVDRQIYRGSVRRRLMAYGLESDDAHDAVFNQMPEPASVQFLQMVLDPGFPSGESLVDAWVAGDEAVIAAYVQQLQREYPLWYERVLKQRNEAWLAPLQVMLTGERRFAVVAGAAHFFGPHSVPALLRQRGFDLRRVPVPAAALTD